MEKPGILFKKHFILSYFFNLRKALYTHLKVQEVQINNKVEWSQIPVPPAPKLSCQGFFRYFHTRRHIHTLIFFIIDMTPCIYYSAT